MSLLCILVLTAIYMYITYITIALLCKRKDTELKTKIQKILSGKPAVFLTFKVISGVYPGVLLIDTNNI